MAVPEQSGCRGPPTGEGVDDGGDCSLDLLHPAMDVEASLLQLIETCRTTSLPNFDIEQAIELVLAGECLVALENLCVQLVEHDVRLNLPLMEDIQRIGALLGMAERYWQRLPRPT